MSGATGDFMRAQINDGAVWNGATLVYPKGPKGEDWNGPHSRGEPLVEWRGNEYWVDGKLEGVAVPTRAELRARERKQENSILFGDAVIADPAYDLANTFKPRKTEVELLREEVNSLKRVVADTQDRMFNLARAVTEVQRELRKK